MNITYTLFLVCEQIHRNTDIRTYWENAALAVCKHCKILKAWGFVWLFTIADLSDSYFYE